MDYLTGQAEIIQSGYTATEEKSPEIFYYNKKFLKKSEISYFADKNRDYTD